LSAKSEVPVSYTSGTPSEKPGVQTTQAPSTKKADLGEFIATHQSAFRDAMASALRRRADVDDALQHAYLRLFNEYDRWPPEQTPEERLAYAYQAIHLAAKDVLRHELGRADRAPKPREIPVDFTQDSRQDADAAETSPIAALAQERLSREASRYPGDDEHLDNALKVAALAALDPVAHRIVTSTGLSAANHKELADELQLSHQFVRATGSEARALLFSLIACARGRDAREASDVKLFAYLEGQKLNRAERRLVKAHLTHCANCKNIASLHGEVDAVAQRLALPLPLLLGGSGGLIHLLQLKGGVLLSSSAKTGALASAGASTGAGASGGGVAAFTAASGAKLALGLGALTLAAAGTTAAAHHRHSGRDHRPASVATVTTTTAATLPAVTPQRKVLPAAATKQQPHLHHKRRKVKKTTTTTTSTPTTVAPPPASPRTAQPVPSTPPSQTSDGGSGGEFVLGGGR
jgi:RNA polymerase sigma factor (sigma-70 family)